MQTQYPGIRYRIDLYFHKYKLVIEVDESLERELDCAFIRINPDEKVFSIFKEVNKVHRHIKKSSKKPLIGKISRRLLELELKSNHSIKSKCLKNMKNTKSEIKPIKVGKQSGTTYCFRCKDYIKTFRPQELKMTKKGLREKSHYVVCRSNKLRFLKQKIN